jgi:hypothetical protein
MCLAIGHRNFGQRHLWQICRGIIDTGGKFATGINNTNKIGRNTCPRRRPVANLPPVSLIQVVHLDLRISLRIFEKILNGPNRILWGWGETDSSKKPEEKIS